MQEYTIYRLYQEMGKPRVKQRSGLTLKQAQAWCSDPETSSMTAKSACNGSEAMQASWANANKHWFDSYSESGK